MDVIVYIGLRIRDNWWNNWIIRVINNWSKVKVMMKKLLCPVKISFCHNLANSNFKLTCYARFLCPKIGDKFYCKISCFFVKPARGRVSNSCLRVSARHPHWYLQYKRLA